MSQTTASLSRRPDPCVLTVLSLFFHDGVMSTEKSISFLFPGEHNRVAVPASPPWPRAGQGGPASLSRRHVKFPGSLFRPVRRDDTTYLERKCVWEGPSDYELKNVTSPPPECSPHSQKCAGAGKGGRADGSVLPRLSADQPLHPAWGGGERVPHTAGSCRGAGPRKHGSAF